MVSYMILRETITIHPVGIADVDILENIGGSLAHTGETVDDIESVTVEETHSTASV